MSQARYQTLSKDMKRYIEAVLDNPQARQNEIAAIIGVHPNTVSSWKRMCPAFTEEIDRRLREKFEAGRSAAIETVVNKCEEGDLDASKFLLKCCGYEVNKSQVEVSTPQGFTINIGGDNGECNS